MKLTSENLTAAQAGEPVRIDTNGKTFYLLSQRVFEALQRMEDGSVTKEEMDLLADEADLLISQSETDEY